MAGDIITWAADKILEFIKSNSKIDKERFEKIYEPMYENLTIIHNFYRNLFNKIINTLPDQVQLGEEQYAIIKVTNEKGYIQEKRQVLVSSPDYQDNIKTIHAFVERERFDNLTIRVQIRDAATVCLREIEKKIEFKFVWSVMNYFINYKNTWILNVNDNIYHSAEEMLLLIKNGKRHNTINSLTASPSNYVSDLFQSGDSEHIKSGVKSILYELQQFYEEANIRFMELKFERHK